MTCNWRIRGVNYGLDDGLKDHIERRLRFALGRFAARIRSVDGPPDRRQRAAWGARQALPDRRRPGPPGHGDGRGLGGRPVRPRRRAAKRAGRSVRRALSVVAGAGPYPHESPIPMAVVISSPGASGAIAGFAIPGDRPAIRPGGRELSRRGDESPCSLPRWKGRRRRSRENRRDAARVDRDHVPGQVRNQSGSRGFARSCDSCSSRLHRRTRRCGAGLTRRPRRAANDPPLRPTSSQGHPQNF